ncbi:putative membrane protein [Chloracidobacterium thermophilum B]|uniref:Putative membrane protein n=2 Tax=Chloracidobacterium thermophilum TaxID=458033 RepID=G2LFT3_CHLTF|nr:putative membrane protein [Chloracidobacterium thermophilum B]
MMPGGGQPPGPLGLQPNVAGLLAYAPCCIGLILSIIFIAVEKSNRFVKFHAWQGLFFHLIVAVIGILNSILGTVLVQISGVLSLLSTLFGLVIFLASLGASIFLMVKAYGNEMTKLPLLGDLAEKQS